MAFVGQAAAHACEWRSIRVILDHFFWASAVHDSETDGRSDGGREDGVMGIVALEYRPGARLVFADGRISEGSGGRGLCAVGGCAALYRVLYSGLHGDRDDHPAK